MLGLASSRRALALPKEGIQTRHVKRNFIIIASKKGLNFSRGGLSYEINNKYIEIEKYVKIGDVVCNDYKVKHGVKKITSSKNQSGRFSVVLSMHKV